LLHRHKLRAVVDDPALAIGRDLAEHTLDLHADLRLCRVHHDLRRDLRAFVELHDREHVGGEHRILLGRGVDHGERDDRALAFELVLDNFPGPAAVRAEGPWREEVPSARLAFRSHHVVPLGQVPPEPCNRHDYTLPRMWTATVAPVPPTLCVMPIFAPSTWRLPAVPRSCWTISQTCLMPVAPTGWPQALRPPLVFTGIFPPRAVSPSAVNLPASPFLQKPRSSMAQISAIEKQTCTSTMLMSLCERCAILNARCPAATVASSVEMSRRSCSAIVSLA